MPRVCIFFLLCAGVLAGALLPACNKTIVNPQTFPAHPAPAPDTLHDLKHLIDSIPDADLFLLALQRTGYDSLLRQTSSNYTLLIPSDSVLIAAGYTKDVISYLEPSLLVTGIIVNQVWNGVYSDTLLDNALSYVPAGTITNPANGTAGTFPVAKQAGPAGGLWINGAQLSNAPSGIRASNGYLYMVDSMCVTPTVNAWSFLLSRPEFSYFVAACRWNDSITQSEGNYYEGYSFNTPLDTNIFLTTTSFTYFVPTNQAFINAGFNTLQDIYNYAMNYQPDYTGTTLSGLDTIIYGHWMPGFSHFCYDIQRNPDFYKRPAQVGGTNNPLDPTAAESQLYFCSVDVNTGYIGGNSDPKQGLNYPYIGMWTFATPGNAVTITCNSGKHPPAATIVERDMVCAGGVILQGVDHLFWPY